MRMVHIYTMRMGEVYTIRMGDTHKSRLLRAVGSGDEGGWGYRITGFVVLLPPVNQE